MTSIRRRSHSASSSLDVSSSLSTKRAYPNHFSPESSPQKFGESWRQGKRRRRESSVSNQPRSAHAYTLNSMQPHPKDSSRNSLTHKPSLATTSAEFHLFRDYERNIDRRHSACNFSSSFDFTLPLPSSEPASQGLQSEAFVALSKSITENGEGRLATCWLIFETSCMQVLSGVCVTMNSLDPEQRHSRKLRTRKREGRKGLI